MKAVARLSVRGVAVAGLLLCGSVAASAAGPIALSNRQLDGITAGGATVASLSDASATGVLALTGTTGNSIVVPGASPYAGQPGLGSAAGAAEGTALAVGTNLALQNEPSPTAGTAVTTNGVADGNLVLTSSIKQTMHGAGGITFQVGWTFVYGAWVGL